MKIKRILAGFICGAALTLGLAVPAEASYYSCYVSGWWGAWKQADFAGSPMYCENGNINAYVKSADNQTSSISNRRGYYVDFYDQANYGGEKLYMPANFSHNDLKKQNFNDKISSTRLR
ncbi:MAG: peptidase inhibitor family I36 protein [Bifidobacteriaceae bacterium]|jgi:hypothetical protein|nr:peptidase inhibitor family I36 protein [Bifidobacteriaceae bacterium]